MTQLARGSSSSIRSRVQGVLESGSVPTRQADLGEVRAAVAQFAREYAIASLEAAQPLTHGDIASRGS
jgi:hypothetical protein